MALQWMKQHRMPEAQTEPKVPEINIGKDVLDYKEPNTLSGPRQEMTLEDMWGRLPNSRWKNTGRMWQIKVFGDADTVTTGDDKAVWMIPPELDGVKLVRIIGFLSTNSSSGAITVQFSNTTQ